MKEPYQPPVKKNKKKATTTTTTTTQSRRRRCQHAKLLWHARPSAFTFLSEFFRALLCVDTALLGKD